MSTQLEDIEEVSAAAEQPLPTRTSLFGGVLMSGGFSAVLVAVFADFLRNGEPGRIGPSQALLLLMGVAAIVSGSAWALPRQQRSLGAALQALQTEIGLQWLPAVIVVAQAALLAVVLQTFHVEDAAFYERILPLALYGFVIQQFLPLRYRLPFFVGLSLVGVWSVFGHADAAWLLTLGVLLIGIAHLPIGFRTRVGLLILVGGALAALRAGTLTVPWSAAVWPILGSIFMFRLILYMYELRHAREPVNWWRSIAYFFLLPNLVFPLFPVVDFATFRRTYYDQDRYAIYQRGIDWMLRGTVHLLIYRFVYQYLTLPATSVANGTDLVRFLLSNFLLYLRVSGQFHLVIGMLHLFGFRLPETHRLFYLASSFTDFWRRINIYWKDFMQKVFYYPVYFRLKKRGNTFALVGSTLLVFFATWVLHSYQWFWIIGRVLMSTTDVLFWSSLAVLLVGNALWEARRGRKRVLHSQRLTWRQAGVRGLQTLGTFTVICVLWSLWSSPTLPEWLSMWGAVQLRPGEFSRIAAALITSGVALAVYYRSVLAHDTTAEVGPQHSRTRTIRGVAVMIGLYLLLTPAISTRLNDQTRAIVRDLRVSNLSRQDEGVLLQGYYENLTATPHLTGQLMQVYAQRPKEWPNIWDVGAARYTGDFEYGELLPLHGTVFRNESFRTNRFGMRDQEYDVVAPPNTFRLAVLGESYVMGEGVSDGETFEALVEKRLNNAAAIPAGEHYEMLNFAMAALTPPQQILVLERKVLRFHPDEVLLIAHNYDFGHSARHLARVFLQGTPIPFDTLNRIVQRAGLVRGMKLEEAERRLTPYRAQIIGWSYQQIADMCRQHGIRPVWLLIPTPGGPWVDQRLEQPARTAGFEILPMEDAYKSQDLATLQVAPWDVHPNAKGHALIADALYKALRARPELLHKQAARAD